MASPAGSSSMPRAPVSTSSAAARAVLRRIGLHLDPGLAARDQEQGDCRRVAGIAAGARRDDEGVGVGAAGNDVLVPLSCQVPPFCSARVSTWSSR